MNYIKKAFLITLLTPISICATPKAIIMIDPASPSRSLHKGSVRSETYRCAEVLKKALEERYHSLKVLLTRVPGDTIVPLQNASFANRSNINLFFHIDFHKQTDERLTIQPLHFVSDPLLDYAHQENEVHEIVPLHQAHRQSITQSKVWGCGLKQQLEQRDSQKLCVINDVQGIPVRPLFGITAPAIALDIGLWADDQWHILIQPLVDAIGQLLYTEH